jgi:hypothetical protein
MAKIVMSQVGQITSDSGLLSLGIRKVRIPRVYSVMLSQCSSQRIRRTKILAGRGCAGGCDLSSGTMQFAYKLIDTEIKTSET